MRQILTMIFFTIVSPLAAVIYFIGLTVREIVRWHRTRHRYRYSTPAQRESFELAHQERLAHLDAFGQTVTVPR